MLYLNHDFYSNFNSGIQSGDNDFITDMIVNELSELIVYNHDSLLDLMNSVGISVNEKMSDEKVINLILSNIKENIKLVKGLAFLIAQNNLNVKNVRVVKSQNGQETVMKSGEKAATISQIDMVASGIVGLADTFKYKPQLEKEFKIKLMEKIKTKSKAVGDRKIKHEDSGNGKYWLLAILVIGAGVGAYFYFKNKKAKAELGMELAEAGTEVPVEPEIPVEPTIPVSTEVSPNIEHVQTPVEPTIPVPTGNNI